MATAKTSPETVNDTRSDAQKMATAHVDNWTPPKSLAEDAGEDEAPDLGDLKLPKTAHETHALMQEVLAIEPASRKEFDLKKAKLSAIRAHLFEQEQGAKPPVLSVSHHQAMASTSAANAVTVKLNQLSIAHPEVKALLAENAALKARTTELKFGAKELAIAKAICAALETAKSLAELKKTISDLETPE